MLFIWLLAMALLFVGTLVGRQTYKRQNFPCAVNPNFVRPLPNDRPFYMQPIVFCFTVGVLPFGSMFIEMYYIFNSFWNYKFYYVYGFMLVVFLLVTLVTACCAIVSTYLLLNWEDWRWKWISMFSGGSTAFYVFLYSTFYYYTKTQMNGFFQTSFYFDWIEIENFYPNQKKKTLNVFIGRNNKKKKTTKRLNMSRNTFPKQLLFYFKKFFYAHEIILLAIRTNSNDSYAIQYYPYTACVQNTYHLTVLKMKKRDDLCFFLLPCESGQRVPDFDKLL
ncbi:hypothetical protein RFI_30381 [Reticulomyxa filosa]|uniref:Transmembrane 9 superfamily member n=1 Tax=Reticulomyxa filosa TaxID=46433 RepID=X6M084_RETFI|nr:hypothetical protein RFI_30381 [Reticulomyxa filosa]|eukprot:ETO07011.1 hypothetical protein RFI_30381 [Reticulomyxa filosa]